MFHPFPWRFLELCILSLISFYGHVGSSMSIIDHGHISLSSWPSLASIYLLHLRGLCLCYLVLVPSKQEYFPAARKTIQKTLHTTTLTNLVSCYSRLGFQYLHSVCGFSLENPILGLLFCLADSLTIQSLIMALEIQRFRLDLNWG